MYVHLVDGTYELFRYHYSPANKDPVRGATRGVVASCLMLLEQGATHVAVATDHVIESFRNDLWAGYKDGSGIDRDLRAQFPVVEDALRAAGFTVWPMVEQEADDALASAAYLASADDRVEKVCIWTPDKDLAQCVVANRVVQVDRRSGEIRDEARIMAKFGVGPSFIADFLALVGDSSDGYPGLPGIGPKTAARLIGQHGHLEQFPASVLGENRERALLFKTLATLRTDAPLFDDVEQLRWTGPTATFASVAQKIGNARLAERATRSAYTRSL